jgi:hypothetical protein
MNNKPHPNWKTNQYDSRSLVLTPWVELTVWQPMGTRNGPPRKWRWSCLGKTGATEHDTVEVAQLCAERTATRHMAIAITALAKSNGSPVSSD